MPDTKDLQGLYQTEETKQHARDWLTEAADVREFKDRWVSGRDLVLEIVVIALIGWEIHMGYRQETQQSKNFADQQRVLTNLGDSSKATADILTSLKATTEAMNESVKRSAAATEANAATSAQTLHMSERPYLACAVSMPALPKAGDKLRLITTVSNAGKGLAIDVETLSQLVIVPKGTSAEDAHASATTAATPPSKLPLTAGQQTQQILDLPSVLTEADITNVADQKVVVYAFVDATYKDLFGRRHRTEVCEFYYPPIAQMVNCATLNKAD